MSQYTVYHNNNTSSQKVYPYLLDVQTTLLNSLETRIVIPLTLKDKYYKKIITNLNPVIIIEDKEYLALTQQLAAIQMSLIGKEVSSDKITISRNTILSSIDFLMTGI